MSDVSEQWREVAAGTDAFWQAWHELADLREPREIARRLVQISLSHCRAHGARVLLPLEGRVQGSVAFQVLAAEGHGFCIPAPSGLLDDLEEGCNVLEVHATRLPRLDGAFAILPLGSSPATGLLEVVGADSDRLEELGRMLPTAALALSVAGLRAASNRREREVQVLADLARRLGSTLDLGEVLTSTAEIAARRLGLERAFVGLYDEIGETTATTGNIFAYGFKDDMQDQTVRIGPESFKHLVLRGQPLLIDDTRGYDSPLATRLRPNGMGSCIIAPLAARGRPLGVLYIDTTEPGRLISEADLWLALSLAEQASLAIDNARLYAEESRKRLASEALREVAQTLSGTLHLGEILESILDAARRLFNATACAVFQLAEDGETLRIRSALGLETEYILQVRARLGQGVVGQAVAENRPKMMRDIVERWMQFPQEWRGQSYTRSLLERGEYPFRGLLGLPLASRGKVFGGLALYFQAPADFSDEDIYLLEVFAGQAALAIENARLYEEEVRREREAVVLLNLARQVGSEPSRRVVGGAAEEIASAVGADRCCVGFFQSDLQLGELYAFGVGEMPVRLPLQHYARFLEARSAVTLPEGLCLEGACCGMVAPLFAQERLIGFIYADRMGLGSVFSEHELNLVTAIAEQMSLALSNQRLFEALRRQEAQYRLLAEAAQDLIVTTDVRGEINYVNPASARVLGYAPEELIGRNFRDFLSSSGIEQIREAWRMCVLEPNQGRALYQGAALRKDGGLAYLELNLNALTRGDRIIGALAVARDLTEQHGLVEEIAQRGRALEVSEERRLELRTYLSLFTQAQEEERKRIARELHDDTAQVLVAITRRLDRLSCELEDPRLKQRAEDIREDLGAAIESVRRFSRNLRPSVLDDLGLLPALEWLASKALTPTRLEVSGAERRLSGDIELTLFRVVQEALTNIDKHAQANVAAIRVRFLEDEVQVHVSDDGIGFVPENLTALASRGHLGLLGLRERVELAGGSLEVDSEPGRGTEMRFAFRC
ncbi:PAS domain S-box-containing protein [Deinobacterium chartae]|uniref:histidine kinase n=1 Tax=Deinobacterium chartae TaxID=521158 RepID=A0A841HZ57_9DEIO|nr:GAF domain-containing protein [Deinobacterium chartae]MBB6097182.1 PAS domain S-box-containing protein [Deinobacterium chartae]